jgi:hypothetical protein
MLIQVDRNELGDKRLDEKENVARKREECIAMAGKKRLVGQDDLEDTSRVLGPRIPFADFVTRLKRIIPTLTVRDGLPGNVALYAPCNAKELEESERCWQHDKPIFFRDNKYVGGFPKQPMHEYSSLEVEEYTRLANKEIRGWRTVLIMLLEQGLVSYEKVVKEFGDVGLDRRGWRWRESTQKWRDNPESKFQGEE